MMKRYSKPILAVVVFLLMQLLAGGIIAIVNGILHQDTFSPTLIALSTIVSGLLTVVVVRRMRMLKTKNFNPKNVQWKHAALPIVGALLGIIGANLLSEQIDLPNVMEVEFLALSRSFWGILAIVFIGPIVEEIVFREAVIGQLIRHGEHRWVAIVFSALCFGISHLNPAQIPFAAIMGLVLGVVYVRTHSIVFTSIVHILNNAISVIEMNILGERATDISYAELLGGNAIAWVYIVVSGALCVLFLREFWKKYHRPYRSSGVD